MPRRYRRSEVAVFERSAVAVPEFPSGQGPPLYLSVPFADCVSLAPGEAALVPFDGTGGAICHGLLSTRAVVLARIPGDRGDGPGAAYCLHAPTGPLDAAFHLRGFDELGRAPVDPVGGDDLFVVVAARDEVTRAEERFFLSLGVSGNRLFTYSNCHLPQFGVSGRGLVGEAR